MTDSELVIDLIKLGFVDSKAMCWHARLDKKSPVAVFTSVESLVCDWRVAGALIEKCQKVYIEYIGEPEQTVYARAEDNRTWEWPAGESLPRTIIEACCEALQGEGD